MKDKHYNLTEKPNGNGKDKMPEWMEKVFEKPAKNDEYKQLFTTPKVTTKKCQCCGNILKNNEVQFCSNCI